MSASHAPQLLKQLSMSRTFDHISVYCETHVYFYVPLNTYLAHSYPLFMSVLKHCMEMSMSEDAAVSCGR